MRCVFINALCACAGDNYYTNLLIYTFQFCYFMLSNTLREKKEEKAAEAKDADEQARE